MSDNRKSNTCENNTKNELENTNQEQCYKKLSNYNNKMLKIYDFGSKNETKLQPKTCQEVWKRCQLLCSSMNPLNRIKNHKNACCIVSPIPTTADNFQPFFEPKFSRRTTFSYYHKIIEVDHRCICLKFNGIDEKCKHPECKNNWKCLVKPSPLCLPAQNWKKYYGQI